MVVSVKPLIALVEWGARDSDGGSLGDLEQFLHEARN